MDCYTLLGIERTASEDDVRRAFRKQALVHHPDRGGNADTFKEINAAYEVLSDPTKRAIFDHSGMEGVKRAAGGAPPPPGHDPIADILAHMAGAQRPPPHRKAGPQTSAAQHIQIGISLEQYYSGCIQTITLNVSASCDACSGTGSKQRSKPTPCAECRGCGRITQVRQIAPGMVQQIQHPCGACNGQGFGMPAAEDRCADCSATTVVQKQIKHEVRIEPGQDLKTPVRIPGGAGQAPHTTAPGDLLISLVVTPHATFQLMTIPGGLLVSHKITLGEALTSFQFHLRHLDGRVLLLRSPAYLVQSVAPDQVQCVRGEGMPRGDGTRGDLYVRFQVEFPQAGSLRPELQETLKILLPRSPAAAAVEGQTQCLLSEAVDLAQEERQGQPPPTDAQAEPQQQQQQQGCRQQ